MCCNPHYNVNQINVNGSGKWKIVCMLFYFGNAQMEFSVQDRVEMCFIYAQVGEYCVAL